MLENLFNHSIQITIALQQMGAGLMASMKFFSQLGTLDFYVLVMPLIYWTMDSSLGLRLGLLLMLSGSLNSAAKWALHFPRPYWVDPRVQAQWLESNFGAPSGHAQLTISLYGLIAVTLKRRWVWALAILLTFLVGLSRIALGAHFYLDVVVGWIIGLGALVAFLRFEQPVRQWIGSKAFSQQITILLAASMALVALGVLAVQSASDFVLPPEWEVNAVAGGNENLDGVFSFDEILTPAGAFFGFGAGAIWLEQQGGFQTKGRAKDYVLRILLGLAGAVFFWQGLGAILPREQDLLSYTLRFLRYGLLGFWIAGWAPRLFVRFGWAKASERDRE